jgi:hypothetical protein
VGSDSLYFTIRAKNSERVSHCFKMTYALLLCFSTPAISSEWQFSPSR